MLAGCGIYGMEEDSDSALLNACVLVRLFEFLDVNSLKRSRLVCQTWNELAGSALRKRATVKFKFYEEIATFNHIMTEAVEDSTSKRLKNFSFDIFEHELSRSLVLALLTEYHLTVESLKFRLHGDSRYAYDPPDVRVLANAFTALPALEHLTMLDLPCSVLGRNAFEGKTFPKLKTCCLSSNGSQTETGDGEEDFVIQLLKACQSTVQKLQLGKFSPRYYRKLFEIVNLKGLRQLVIGIGDAADIPTDILLELPVYCPNLEYVECFFRMETPSEEITDVLKGLVNVQSIKLRGWNMMKALPNLPNVKNLALKISFEGDQGQLANCLPNLKKLELELNGSNPTNRWKTMEKLEELTIGKHFAAIVDEQAQFDLNHNTFPRLTKLTIKLPVRSAKHIFSSLINLKELTIVDGSIVTDEDITGVCINSSSKVPRREDQIQRADPYVGDLKRLQVLSIGSCFITSDSLKYGITDLESLTNLTLRDPLARVVHFAGMRESRGLIFENIAPGSHMFDLQYLMPPKVPYLVQLTVITRRGSPCPVDYIQVDAINRSRKDFTYTTVEKDFGFAGNPVLDFHLGI